jgi:hypothetical protein
MNPQEIEQSLRSEDFRPGVPIRLFDGAEWHFVGPKMLMFPQWTDGDLVFRNGTDYGPEWDRKFLDTAAAFEAGDFAGAFGRILWFADAMLVRNYRPEVRDHYDRILRFDINDKKHISVFLTIWTAAGPPDPKDAFSGGSPTPSGPTGSTPGAGTSPSASASSTT